MSDKTAVGAYDDDHEDKQCPNCGYCPTCGRASTPSYPAYPYPYWYQPWWQAPNITWTTTDNSSPTITGTFSTSTAAGNASNVVYLTGNFKSTA